MREGATGPSVPLATHSATTEESIVTRPSRRSSRLYALRENTQDVKTEVKTEDSPERLTVSFKFHEDKMRRKASMLKKAQRDLAKAQYQLWKLQKVVSRAVVRLESVRMTVPHLQSWQYASPAIRIHRAAVPMYLYALMIYHHARLPLLGGATFDDE